MAVTYTITVSGGISVTGKAGVRTQAALYKPVGGINVGGAPRVVYNPVVFGKGGARLGGKARTPLHIAVGGASVAGSATQRFTKVFVASGGVQIAASALSRSIRAYQPTGGLVLGGHAALLYKNPVYNPKSGLGLSGAALSYFVPSGAVTTPENPYNNPFEAWAVNYETAAASRYARMPGNSICRFKGVTYVANAGGIYALDADTDAGQPINASITLGTTDYGVKYNKRVQYVYLGFKSDLPMLLTTHTNKKTKSYSDVQPAGGGNRGSRAILGRGLEGLYWAFKLENKNGAYFELDNFRLEATITNRMGV